MKAHLQREIENVKKRILSLCAEVESDLLDAVRAMEGPDPALAREVIDGETRSNALEVDVEEECLKLLALYQPVAGDLRYIIAVLKINQDLERIGDLAAHIAERSLVLCENPAPVTGFRLGLMAEKVRTMLKQALDAFVTLDGTAARAVCAADAEVDNLNHELYIQVRNAVMKEPNLFEPLLQVLSIGRHLERIADHATNIAEDVIYLAEGRIVRHQQEVSDKAMSHPPEAPQP
jgi:phosphate transport system protein